MNKMKTDGFFQKKRQKQLIFSLIVVIIPIIQFCIFYIGVNFNSILMAFQKYEINEQTNLGKYQFNGLKNFRRMFFQLKYENDLPWALKNSIIAFLVNIGVGTTLALIFSLYIFKGMVGSKTFRAILFAPSILSSIVTVTMYKNFVETAIPEIFNLQYGLLGNPDTRFGALLFFMIWVSFGTQILIYSGAMNTIDPSVIEAAKLDGASPLREFLSIILPLIYPTVTTFLVTNIAGLLTNQMNLFAFYANGADPELRTMGYYLFRQTNTASLAEYPLLATYGVALTLIAAPITLLGKKVLESVGPKTE
ncbi:MAG: sugar ABC transporter permease [Clostridia bacterium]|nr:sugar ABC transporter permease [Clostridia bacterium]